MSAHSEIKNLFLYLSSKIDGYSYYHDGKQARHIKLLEKRYIQDKHEFKKMLLYYRDLILNNDDWADETLCPSSFNSLYDTLQEQYYS